MWRLIFSLLLATATWGQTSHPILATGSPAPDFSLPGVDGKIHRLADYSASPILVIVFTCNHCPIAQMYEQRIQQLDADYSNRGVALVAIQPNDPKALRIDELDSSDLGDTLEEMKIRVEYRHLHYTYLYDGETQSVARALGPQATPHVFIFDKNRKLRYEGRMDNSYREEMINTQDARNALDALLANREVPVKHTGVFGCSTKWQEKSAQRLEALRKIAERPITVEMATAADLKHLRENPSKHMTLISFWATWCGACIDEFADLEQTYLMYQVRDFDLVTVAANMPDEKPGVLKMLEKKQATSRNLLFASDDTASLQAAFDPTWQSAVPYTVLLDADSKVLYKNLGSVDILELRRTILANLPSDYIGFNQYWQTGLAQKEPTKSGAR
ncbi:MAG TPA: redoxin family protein [Candidatus Eisenbacteria bacterium]|jgi:peroxiredoxin|nr:redoxin family protein [Candidatus Eisenbacteria bacterium]